MLCTTGVGCSKAASGYLRGRVLRQTVQAFKQVSELYDENLLREGMDKHESELGFTASHLIVVGATDKHSFDNVLRQLSSTCR